jgi:hypothetical protein
VESFRSAELDEHPEKGPGTARVSVLDAVVAGM